MPAQFQASAARTEVISAGDGGFSGGSDPTAAKATDTPETPVETPALETPVEIPVEGNEQQVQETQGEKPPVSLDMFKQAREGVIQPAKPTDEKDKANPETKKVDAQQTDQTQAKPENTQQAQQTISRESVLKELGIPEDQHKLYKFMSNDAFNKVKELLTENKALKGEVEKSRMAPPPKVDPLIPLYGNPEGYLLDPQYKQSSAQASLAQSALNHYAQQLDRITQGQPWRDLEADQQGNLYVVEKDIEPTESGRIAINEKIREIQEIKIMARRQVEDIRNNYSTRSKQDLEVIRGAETKYFPDYDKPDHWSQPIQKQFIELLPPSQRHNPLANSMAKMAANNSYFKNNWEKSEKRAQEAEKKVKELEDKIKTVGNPQTPTKNRFQAGGGSVKPTISVKDFERVRYGI